MSANIIRLLPDEERALFDCYVTGSDQRVFPTALRHDGGFQQRNAGSLQIAVAQILLHHVQDSLPQWAAIYARPQFTPRLLFSINWATSGPGFEWPEAYHVTYVPGLEKHIFTESRDGPDAFGCERRRALRRTLSDDRGCPRLHRRCDADAADFHLLAQSRINIEELARSAGIGRRSITAGGGGQKNKTSFLMGSIGGLPPLPLRNLDFSAIGGLL